MRLVGQHPYPLLDDMPLQRRFVAKFGNDAFQSVGIKDRPLHILGAGYSPRSNCSTFNPALAIT